MGELVRLFLRLGFTAFGGPAAHVALMKRELVERRRWYTEDEFLHMLGVTQLIPGPNSTEMALHIGWQRRGPAGMLAVGLCFIGPAALMVGSLAWAYRTYAGLDWVQGPLHAIKPVIIAIVLQALAILFPVVVRTRLSGVAFAVALLLAGGGVDELAVMLGCGVATAAWRRGRAAWPFAVAVALVLALAHASTFLVAGNLVVFFLKIGSLTYGSGYVLLAFLRDTLVDQWHLLTMGQLLDATAVGQLTPGPLFTTATFIGYLAGGPLQALACTVAIFLPSFCLVPIAARLLRPTEPLRAFLEGVNAGSLALMTLVTLQLGRAAIVDPFTAVLAVIAGGLLALRVNSAWLILGAGALGWWW